MDRVSRNYKASGVDEYLSMRKGINLARGCAYVFLCTEISIRNHIRDRYSDMVPM